VAADRIVFACSCEGTVPLDEAALARGCGGTLRTADNLCQRQLQRFKAALAGGEPITVSCTQEAPLFAELAEAAEAGDRVAFANIRENAGWAEEGRDAGPKMAALLAAAAEPVPAAPLVSLRSDGVALIYGQDEMAIEAGRRLAERLDITVLLTEPGEVAPASGTEFPVLRGTIVTATGHLGAFELTVNDYAVPAPSSRGTLAFGPGRDGATSRCDLILDLSGGMPLFPAHELRSGYLRADPRDPLAVERAIFDASHLVGEFDKPRYIEFSAELCAHSRSRITGCTRCLDVCPTSAITPAGDHVAIDAYICAGCGSCAAVCPSGAAAYALPPPESLLRRLRTLLRAYCDAGGSDGILLLHDQEHGWPLLDALARFGPGLPARILPVQINEVTAIGLEAIAGAFAFGAAGAMFLTRAKPRHDTGALERTVALANAILVGLGYGEGISVVAADDPDLLRAALDGVASGTVSPAPARYMPLGAKRNLLESSLQELHRAAPTPADLIPLPAGAPVGGLDIEIAGCTLCLACVAACPTSALGDDPERPLLRFTESLCVQCGLCAATCPERVIRLKPQLDFAAWRERSRIVKTEEPFECVACGKPFGTRSSIERIIEKLQGRHWMFSGADGEQRVRMLMMCEDCRVEAAANEAFDPHAAPPRPRPRTTDDYLREREEGKDDLP
jgi:ferredoxin